MSDTVEDTPSTGQKFTAETMGTFVLVFFGCGAALMSGGDYVATGLTFGLTVVVMAYAVGRISGGHFNPAVTLGAVLGGRLPWNQAGIYMAAQLLGGLVAGGALFGIMNAFPGYDVSVAGLAQNGYGDQSASNFALWGALVIEILLTAVFLWVILAVTDERNEVNALMGPLAIGLTLAMIHFASMGATGTSVNPARSIGVGVFAGTDAIVQLWVFVLAPLVGAAIAGLTYPLLFGQGAEPVAGSGLNFGGGKKGDQFVPGNYEAQWNQGQQGGWGQPGAAWGAPPQQQWGQPSPQQQPQQPDPAYGAPQAAPPGQWGAPQQQPQQPQQPPAQPGQWGAPQQQQPAQPGQQSAPGHWGNPDGDDDGRTQVRRPD
ncbi:MIP family channel protein [Nocardioides hwasunensis]|uniref:MIP family channel protein n=1 Tax=Nocardioides hwasunensis TaxID=397258 RepID=A0ABR8MHH9_9ACTN|nr:MIP family channel protein [Nocardioides hwasunensis]MBD3914160.1 MIP family channel protein [Nocardioides hwasunensis]